MRTPLLSLALSLTLAVSPAASENPVIPDSAVEAFAAFRGVDHAAAAQHTRGSEPVDGWQERLRAEWELGALDGTAIPVLENLLADEDPYVRALGARAIGLAGGEDATETLIKSLAVEKHAVAAIATIEALARIGGEGALAAVEAKQKPGADKNVSNAVALARRQLKGGRWDVESIREEHREARRIEKMGVLTREDEVPEIALSSMNGPVNLSTHEGEIVVLVFSHGDKSVKGHKVLNRLSGQIQNLTDWGVRVVVVTPHEKERAKAWEDRMRLPFTVCADPAGRAQALYGVGRQLLVGAEWMPSPAWFVIDKRGRLAWEYIGKHDAGQANLGKLMPRLERLKNGEIVRD